MYFKLAEIGKFGSLLETRESFYRSEKKPHQLLTKARVHLNPLLLVNMLTS